MIAINLNKKEALDADPKAIRQIHFTGNIERGENATVFFFIQEAKETYLRLFTRNLESTVISFCLNLISNKNEIV